MVMAAIGADHDNATLALAATDLATVPFEERQYVRYVAVPARMCWDAKEMKEAIQLTALVTNYLSLSSLPYRPVAVEGRRKAAVEVGPKGVKEMATEQAVVVRLDLRRMAPRSDDLSRLVTTWEELRFDPVYNRLLTRDTIKFAGPVKSKKIDWKLIDVPPYVEDGKTFTQKWQKIETDIDGLGDEPVVRVVAPHLDKVAVATLIDGTQSQAPIVSLPYFAGRSMRTVRDEVKGKPTLYTLVYGGLYYEMAGIRRGAKKGTDEDVLLEALGVGNVEQGITAAKVFERLRSDQRTAMRRSGVTIRARQIEFLPTLGAKLGTSRGLFVATRDNSRKDIDIGTSPTANLLNFKQAGSEIIWERANGLHGFAAADANGKFVDQVPDDIAADTTIPPPHGTVLESAISCIRCHRTEGGWRIVKNSVRDLLKSGRFDIFDDLNGKTREDVLDRLAGLYSGDLEEPDGVLPRARNDYAKAILRVTGPWDASKSKPAQLDIVAVSGQKLADLFGGYFYDAIDAQRALAEMGVRVESKEAAAKLRSMLAPAPVVGAVALEDERIAALMEGESISRAEFDLVRSFIAARMAIKK